MVGIDGRLDELRQIFSGELDERLSALNHWMLRLERAADDGEREAAFDALLREAHSLKGASRAVDAEPLERLAHALEASLQKHRSGKIPSSSEWFDAVYRGLDLLPALARGADGEGAQLAAVLAGLESPPSADGPAALDTPLEDSTGGETPGLGETPAAPASPPQSELPAASLTSSSGATSRVDADSVRVGVAKLDSLLAQAGELAVTRIRIEQRLAEMRDIGHYVEAWRREWRSAHALRLGMAERVARLQADAPDIARDLQALLRLADTAELRAEKIGERAGEMGLSLGRDTAQLGVVSRSIESAVMATRLVLFATLVGPFERMVRDLSRSSGKRVEVRFEGIDIEIDRRVLEQLRDPLVHMVRNAVDHGIEPPDRRLSSGKPRGRSHRDRGGAAWRPHRDRCP